MVRLTVCMCMIVLCYGTLPNPQGYVLDVTASCSNTTDGVSQIQVLSDIDVHAEADCKDRDLVVFKRHDDVYFTLTTYYTGNTKNRCIFKNIDANTYQMNISVSWAEPGELMLNNESLIVTCTLDGNGGSNFTVEKIKKKIQAQQAPIVSSSALKLTNIDGTYVQNLVPVGDKIQLTATITVSGEDNVTSLKAMDCTVLGEGRVVHILRGGCGTGFTFPKDCGFVTDGKVSKSVPFAAFRFEDNPTVSFYCNFSKCSSNCDGNSCKEGHKIKRHVPHPRDMIQLHTHLQVRAAAPVDAITVDPCRVPGLNPEDCKSSQSQAVSIDLPVGVTSFMMVVMVMFPMVFVISIVVFLCCPKNKNSYGINDPGI